MNLVGCGYVDKGVIGKEDAAPVLDYLVLVKPELGHNQLVIRMIAKVGKPQSRVNLVDSGPLDGDRPDPAGASLERCTSNQRHGGQQA